MTRMSPAASSEIVVSSVASGNTTSADDRSPPPNGYTTVRGSLPVLRPAMNFSAGSAHARL